jgi:hypothetical protein
MRFPRFFSNGKKKTESNFGETGINSDADCVHCRKGSMKTAKLLVVTGQWNFFYCYRCRRWSQSYFSSKEVLIPVDNKRMENSLTWFWQTEKEMMEENVHAIEWIRSIFTGKNYAEEKRSELV